MLSSKTNALLTHTIASFWRKQSCQYWFSTGRTIPCGDLQEVFQVWYCQIPAGNRVGLYQLHLNLIFRGGVHKYYINIYTRWRNFWNVSPSKDLYLILSHHGRILVLCMWNSHLDSSVLSGRSSTQPLSLAQAAPSRCHNASHVQGPAACIWASYQIRKIAGRACAGTFSPPPTSKETAG